MKTLRSFAVFCLLVLASAAPAHAHKPSDSYLRIKADGQQISGQWDIAIRDLAILMKLDTDGNGRVSWGELKAQRSRIFEVAGRGLEIQRADQNCILSMGDLLADQHSDGGYAVLQFTGQCSSKSLPIRIRYTFLLAKDPEHHGILNLALDGNSHYSVFTKDSRDQSFESGTTGWSRWRAELFEFVRTGIWHIWLGYDHMLFLVSLLLPSVLLRTPTGWTAAANLRAVLGEVLKVVTAFTIAHSITLGLVTMGLVGLPSRLVETTIAVSVFLAALNNILPLVTKNRWEIAFLFGLVHGFGFATVLAESGLESKNLWGALIGFNLGVEIGQLAVVAAFLSLIYYFRDTRQYQRYALVAGSAVIAAIAFVWALERLFEFQL